MERRGVLSIYNLPHTATMFIFRWRQKNMFLLKKNKLTRPSREISKNIFFMASFHKQMLQQHVHFEVLCLQCTGTIDRPKYPENRLHLHHDLQLNRKLLATINILIALINPTTVIIPKATSPSENPAETA